MQTLPLCEAFAGAFPSAFNRTKSRKPPCLVPFSSKRRSRRCSFRLADKCREHAKKGKQVSGHTHLKHFGGTNDMVPFTFSLKIVFAILREFRCINGTTSVDLADKKCDCFLMGKIKDSITGQCVSTSLKDRSDLFHGFLFGLKMALLIGIPTFQTFQPAIASPEFASGVQPLTFFGDLGDINTGFASAFLLIFFSELGDKTFFIAALLAARNSSVIVFAGTFGALAAMTIVSVVLGRTFHYVDGILPFRLGETDFPIDDFAAVCLLVYFGVTTLLDAASGDELNIKEEQEEAELAISKLRGNGAGIMAAATTVISTFLVVFVAEWGDKSFFSTIALAAASSPLGVIGGALTGHAFATVLAVLGGSLMGTYFSEKVIAYVGGILFLIFAGVTLAEIIT